LDINVVAVWREQWRHRQTRSSSYRVLAGAPCGAYLGVLVAATATRISISMAGMFKTTAERGRRKRRG